MARKSRYEALKNRIQTEFSRTATLAPELDAGERQTLLNLDDHTDSYELQPRFQKFGPYNFLGVKNMSGEPVKMYLSPDRTSYVTVEANTGATPGAILEGIPTRYIRFLSVENIGGTAINAGEIEIYVGNFVDSVELQLLKDAGLMDVDA